MPQLATPPRPALVTVPNVSLLEVGTWQTSTGEFTWTADDLAAAVEAADDPGLRTPIVKLGHCDPRFDGEPAIGRIENLRVTADGMTLVGDLVGIPAWIADVMASAYPSRSIEGYFEYASGTGRTHKFVLTGLALLGVTIPAIESLDDIAALYGVAAAERSRPDRMQVSLAFPAKEPPMPTPVRAAVNETAIREEFYESQPQGSWAWIREIWVGDGAFIIVDDDNGNLFRIPWTEEAGDVKFGAPEKVQVQYVPAAPDDESDDAPLVLAARYRPLAGQPVAAAAAQPPRPGQEGELGMADLTTIREALGLAADTPDDEVLAAAHTRITTPPEPADKPTVDVPAGMSLVDDTVLEGLKVAASKGAQAHDTLRRQDRDRFLTDAVKAGKFAPARLGHFEALYDADEEGTKDLVAKLAAGTVPLTEVGHAGAGEIASDDALYDQFFGQPAGKEG